MRQPPGWRVVSPYSYKGARQKGTAATSNSGFRHERGIGSLKGGWQMLGSSFFSFLRSFKAYPLITAVILSMKRYCSKEKTLTNQMSNMAVAY
jgi:hypothetical protein